MSCLLETTKPVVSKTRLQKSLGTFFASKLFQHIYKLLRQTFDKSCLKNGMESSKGIKEMKQEAKK